METYGIYIKERCSAPYYLQPEGVKINRATA
jgi:hypothetical protein